MLKQIPKSDINIRPFKTYKRWVATESDGWVKKLIAKDYSTGNISTLTDEQLKENGLYHQLKTMYYNQNNSLNPFVSYGTFKPIYTTNESAKQRNLKERALVFSIPQIKFGEEIKPKSFQLYNERLNETIYDDGFGNLISNLNEFDFISIDFQNDDFYFLDSNNNQIVLKIISLNLENGTLLLQDEDVFLDVVVNFQTNKVIFLGIFTNSDLQKGIIGNVIYSHGIVTITADANEGGNREDIPTFDLLFKSTNTIYENEYLIVVGEDEFNVSTNPTAVTETNIETGSIVIDSMTYYQIDARYVDLNVGAGYVLYNDSNLNELTLAIDENKIYNFYANEILFDGLIGCSLQKFSNNLVKWKNSDKYQKDVFLEYEYSSSIDPIGSYLTPYITTIGLYDENMEMVAIAKLATPVKSMPDLPVNFLVRFDT